jgi:hypothetical protein
VQLVTTHARVPRALARPRTEFDRLRAMGVLVGARVDAQGPSAGPSAFSPTQLPGGLVYWYDLSDATQLFTDTAGTLPAGDGDQVARCNDKSGLGRFIQQATGTARPFRDATSFPYAATFWDGGDRLIASATFTSVPQPFTFFVFSDATANLAMWFDNGAGATRVLAQRGASATSVIINAGASLTVTTPDTSVARAWLFEYNGASSKVWCYDSGTQAFVQQGATGNAGTNALNDARIGGNTANFLQSLQTAEFFAWPAATTAPDRANLAGYALAKYNPA